MSVDHFDDVQYAALVFVEAFSKYELPPPLPPKKPTPPAFPRPPMATIVLGSQFGDEGKGKLVDILCASAKICVRCAGGNNAGHTIEANGVSYDFHMLPSGLVNPGCVNFIGEGVVVHIPSFFKELEILKSKGLNTDDRIYISNRAHIVFDLHQVVDGLEEQELGAKAVGTVSKLPSLFFPLCTSECVSRSRQASCGACLTPVSLALNSKADSDIYDRPKWELAHATAPKPRGRGCKCGNPSPRRPLTGSFASWLPGTRNATAPS